MYVMENEAVYVQFCTHGKVSLYFIGMQPVEIANAPGIYGAIMKSLEFEGLSCLTHSDGASVNMVNTGKYNGVIALLHRNISQSVVLHCLDHALELVLKSE